MKFMLHTEIYVDGLATMQIKNINQIVDAVTLELMEQQNPSSNDLYLNTLEEAYIKEDEYFFHIIHNDLDTILRNIRENHQFDIDSAPIGPTFSFSEIKKKYQKIVRTITNPTDVFIYGYVGQSLIFLYIPLRHSFINSSFSDSI